MSVYDAPVTRRAARVTILTILTILAVLALVAAFATLGATGLGLFLVGAAIVIPEVVVLRKRR